MMRRSSFKRPEYTRPPVVLTPITRQGVYAPAVGGEAVPKPEPVRSGKRTPTVEERRWMDAIVRAGCLACRMDGIADVPGEVHHLLRAGRRIGHMHTICLCPPHHRTGEGGVIARHPWRVRFEQRYAPEPILLAMSLDLVGRA